MNFLPVYRLCRSNGSFSRIGSLLEPCQQWNTHICKPVQVVAGSEDPGRVRGYPRRVV